MKWKPFCFIVIGAIVQAIGFALLKTGTNATSADLSYMILTVALIMIGFLLYNLGLKSTRLSVAQPLFSTTLFLACTLLSMLALHEAVKLNQIVGIIIILAGVFVNISAGEKKIIERKE